MNARKVTTVLLFAVLVLAVAAGPAAAKHAVRSDKATGACLTARPLQTVWWDFSVHETLTGDTAGRGYVHESHTFTDGRVREMTWAVRYANIAGAEAWFAAACLYDSWGLLGPEDWSVYRVFDGGTPGANGDDLRYHPGPLSEHVARTAVETWTPPGTVWRATEITEGNLQVHTY
jgi:hypothetical protein